VGFEMAWGYAEPKTGQQMMFILIAVVIIFLIVLWIAFPYIAGIFSGYNWITSSIHIG
jgi:hypothetical protein